MNSHYHRHPNSPAGLAYLARANPAVPSTGSGQAMPGSLLLSGNYFLQLVLFAVMGLTPQDE